MIPFQSQHVLHEEISVGQNFLHHELMHFLETSGFTLAPRVALERSLAMPLDEVSTEV